MPDRLAVSRSEEVVRYMELQWPIIMYGVTVVIKNAKACTKIKLFYSSGKSFICFEKVFDSFPLLPTAHSAMAYNTGRRAFPDLDNS
jgi:hypothetical protein